MSDYESIHGTRVKYLTSDPTLDSSVEGQVWYNSTSGTNKTLVQIKAFSSGGNLSTGRRASGAMGTQSAGAIAGGQAAPAYVNNTEEYSGFTWGSGGNINTTRAFVNNGTVGTQTAGLIFGGEPNPPQTDLANTEEYDGSSWSESGDLNTARRDLGGCGIQTAALAFGGTSSPTAVTELYDGSSWTTSPGTLNTGRASSVGAGTQTAALAIGGPSTVVESWDGSSWTNGPSLNFQLDGGAGASGTSTDTLTFGGRTPPGTTLVDSSEQYDGNTWVTTPDMSTARRELMGIGTAQLGVACGGFTPPSFSAATEEYNSNINAFTSAAFSSGGVLSTSRAQFGSAKHGTQNAGLAFGGFNWPNTNRSETEEYGGSSWTSGGALPGGQRQMGGTGTQTAALGYGGLPGIPNTTTLEYDGSSWTSGGALPSGMSFAVNSAAGTQTAALRAGSGPGGATATTLEYDGSSWTSANDMSVARTSSTFDGAQTAAIITAGEAPGAPDATGNVTRLTEEYDGTNWSSGTSSLFFLSAQAVSGGAAAQTALMTTGGDGPNVTNNTGATQEYDGTAFTNTANLGSPRRQLNGGGTQTAGLVFGGTEASTTALTATEEYTGSTSTVTASTLTTS